MSEYQLCPEPKQQQASNKEYYITPEHFKTFRYSDLYRVTIRYPMLDPKEGLQPPGSFKYRDIIFSHAVALDLPSNS